MPTSLARFSDLAVLRFMKFIPASINTKMPIMPNSHTYFMLPYVFTPFLNSAYKCHLLIGKRKISGLALFHSSCSIGLTLPKIALHTDSDNKIEDGSFNASLVPLIIFSVSISRASCSIKFPSTDMFFSPKEIRWGFVHDDKTTFLKSLP